MTPEERKSRFRDLQQELRPIHEANIRIHVELSALTTEIAIDDIKAAFPGIEILECVYPRVENRRAEDATPAIIAGFQQAGITPKIAVVDRTRMQISFVV
jgi:hypothetical protein